MLNVVSQAATATGTALVAAVLSWSATVYAPGLPGGVGGAASRTVGAAAALMALAWRVSSRLPDESHATAGDRALSGVDGG